MTRIHFPIFLVTPWHFRSVGFHSPSLRTGGLVSLSVGYRRPPVSFHSGLALHRIDERTWLGSPSIYDQSSRKRWPCITLGYFKWNQMACTNGNYFPRRYAPEIGKVCCITVSVILRFHYSCHNIRKQSNSDLETIREFRYNRVRNSYASMGRRTPKTSRIIRRKK